MMTRLRLLLVSHSPLLATGYGRVTRELAHALASAGHDLYVLGASPIAAAGATAATAAAPSPLSSPPPLAREDAGRSHQPYHLLSWQEPPVPMPPADPAAPSAPTDPPAPTSSGLLTSPPTPVLPLAPERPLSLAQALATLRPDVLLTIGDPWMFEDVPQLLPPRGQRSCRWLAYFPIDGQPLPRAWARWVAAVDRPVVFCDFTRRVVREGTSDSATVATPTTPATTTSPMAASTSTSRVSPATPKATPSPIDPPVVPHGVDLTTFRPMSDKAAAKARVGLDARSFVVGTVAANQMRKNLPALLRAFASFARSKPDAILYLHCPLQGYWDLEELALRLGIAPQTRATLNLDPLGPQQSVDDPTLALLYNSFDVFVLPSMAEGFGLPTLEAQACGVPALVTDYSASPELVPDPFQRVAVARRITLARNFEQALIDEEELAGRLEVLYRNRRFLAELGQKCRAFATGFPWRRMTDALVGMVEEMAEGSRRENAAHR